MKGNDTKVALPQDWREVQRIVQQSGSSFYWPMRLLAAPKRNAMFALYALCRILDDIADSDETAAEKHLLLDQWQSEVDSAYEGAPTQAITRCLTDAIAEFHLPKVEFDELIAGMVMDADGPIVAPDQQRLRLYCRRVAGTVGQLSLHIFGRTEPEAIEFGLHLADALQLTNILRDVAEDAERGRLYLPAELLCRHGVPDRLPEAALRHPGLPAVCAALAEQAETAFTQADRHLARAGRRDMLPALIMMAIYRRILQRLTARGWQQLTPRLRLSKPEKAALILRQLMSAQR